MNGEIKIITRCPSCHNTTLSVNDSGHLFCTWFECKDPTLIHFAGEPGFGPFVIQPPSKEVLEMLTKCGANGWPVKASQIISLDCIATDSCKATTETIKP